MQLPDPLIEEIKLFLEKGGNRLDLVRELNQSTTDSLRNWLKKGTVPSCRRSAVKRALTKLRRRLNDAS